MPPPTICQSVITATHHLIEGGEGEGAGQVGFEERDGAAQAGAGNVGCAGGESQHHQQQQHQLDGKETRPERAITLTNHPPHHTQPQAPQRGNPQNEPSH